MSYPITQAIRFLRQKKVEFIPHLYDYEEKGGTSHSAEILAVDEHSVIKTLVFETNEKKPLIVLMHGDREVSTKKLARLLKVKSISPVMSETVTKLTGYLIGGTSPFGTKMNLKIYVEKTIFDLDKIYINGGKRGFLIEISPKILGNIFDLGRVQPVSVARP